MSEQTIDQLNIEINTKAKGNADELDKLAANIQRLKSSVGAGVDKLSGISASLSKLGSAITDLKSKSGTLSSISNSMKRLNEAKTDRISGNINTLAKSLESLGSVDPSLKTMIADLSALARSGNGGVAENALKLQAQAAKAQATIDQSALKSAKAQEGLKAIAEKNKQIEETARQAATQERELTDSINRAIQEHIAQFGSAGGMSGGLSKSIPASALPDYGAYTTFTGPSRLAASIEDLKKSMGEVGGVARSATNEIASGSSRAARFVHGLKEAFSSASKQISNIGNFSRRFFSMGRFYGWYFILRQIARTFGGWINNINSYIENMNLFDVAMGSAAQSTEKLADSLQSVLGIDSGEAMRYMGVFQELGMSFGIANKQATTMSENLGQLGYDLASFYNISTATSFEKLESVYTGQSRAARSLGIDISNARLQQELYNMGIKVNVNNLTQANKAELRYIAIMKQTTNAQGDMARTIQTPANALRVLQAQLTITGRAIGSIFIPALNAILPPITAVIEVIGNLASELASMFGAKMPKIDYSSLKDIATGTDNVSDAVSGIGNNAAKSQKQMDNLISGFDELHILQADSNSSGSGGSGSAGDILNGIDLPSYDALNTAVSNNIDSLKKKIKDFLNVFKKDPLTTFADAIWGISGAFSDLDKWLSNIDFADVLEGIAAALTTYGLTKNPLLAVAVGALTTALSHLLPERQKIDLLNGTLATLGTALILKTFTGMPFKLSLGISTLLTSGLIELMGKDNAINLLASSLAGLGTGIMAFTFTRDLPLAVGIGLVSSAISGLAIHFSDMQIAPALLAGVTSGLLAFKLGMDSWSAGAVGLGVALASFAELNNISPELRIGLLGLSGAVTALGLAFQAGFGPTGLIISAVAGAFIGLGAGLIQASEDAKKADLEKRFGSISLSAQDVEDIAKRLTTTPWTVKIDAAISAQDKVKEFENTLKSDIETLNKMDWEVSVGIKLTKSEMGTYKSTINSFISDAKSYVQQQQYSVTLAIDAILEPGSATAKNLTTFTNKYYSDTQAELDKLGTQLSNEVNKAFEDNVLSEGEIIKIQDIQKKMNDLLQKIADQKFTATLKSLEMDAKSTEITADSFKDLQDKIQSSIQDRIKQAESRKQQLFIIAQTQFDVDSKKNKDEAQKVYDKSIQDAQEAFNTKKATLELSGLDVSLNTLNSKFSSELETAGPVWAMGIKDAFKHGFTLGLSNPDELYKKPVSDVINGLSGTYQYEINNNLKISDTARASIKELISQLQPTETELKQIAESAKKAGKAVPENVSKGISNIEQMKAIGQDMDSINYMVGKKLSTDSGFLGMLATSKGAGKKIDSNVAQGLTDNIQLVKDSSTGTITGIKDTVTGKVIEITPTLKQNLSQLGIDMSNSLTTSVKNQQPTINAQMNTTGMDAGASMKKGLNSKTPDVTAAGNDLSKGALKGAQDQLQKDKQSWLDWAIWPWNWFKQANDIHSPSKVFEGGGENIVQGLWNGMQSKWNDFTKWWEGLAGTLKVPHFKFGWESLDDFDNLPAKAAKKLGLKKIPTIDIDWYANGGAFSSTSVIGVGEYPNASTNPEVVAPQSIIRETVEESNEGVVAALAKLIELAQQIAEKDNNTYLDGKKISENTNKHNANKGYNLGLQSI